MKNIKALFVLLAMIMFSGQWSMVGAREVTSLNQEWQFRKGTFGVWGVYPNIYVPKGEKVVNLPHTYNDEDFMSDGGYYRGEGSYMKEIDVPESWKGKRIFVKFEGAGSVANVQVNWVQVGEHKGAYNAFTFELTDYLTYGQKNYLLVTCDNSHRFDVATLSGDFNVYKASEPAFQNLVNPSYMPIAFYDPVNQMGDWTINSNFSEYHTQSTHSGSTDCFSGGGMDDRFDFILMSGSIINGTKGITYHPNSYWAVGQDGNRFNGAINSPQNNTLPSNVIDALYNMSDHLPVVAEFDFGDVGFASESTDAGFLSIVQNPVSDVLTMRIRTEKPREVSVDIYSSLGVLLRHYQENVLADEVLEYDVADLPNGAYIVNVRSEGVSVSHRVIKAE